MTTVAVKERPILFSGEMVKAILAGRKVQTRRIIKPQPARGAKISPIENEFLLERWPKQEREFGNFGRAERVKCPFGQPGDHLYLREAWKVRAGLNNQKPSEIPEDTPVWYLADGPWDDTAHPMEGIPGKYRHARFMPRWASRITLEITGVRVERITEISEEDAIAEGLMPYAVYGGRTVSWKINDASFTYTDPVNAFRDLWESTYPGSWERGDFVWVIDFKKVEA